MHTIPLAITDLQGDGYHILLDIEIFDKTFKIVLDTGASKTVLDRNLLLESGIIDEEALQDSNVRSSGLGTTDMQSYLIDLPLLKIGSWIKKKTQVAVLDLSSINYAYAQMNLPQVIGVLGGDILYRYGAVINYKKRTLTLLSRKTNKIG